MKTKDIAGQRFGKLVAIRQTGTYYTPSGKSRGAVWLCACDCGRAKEIVGSGLRRGAYQSCGCEQHAGHAKASRTHGMSRTPTYSSYKSMRSRCENRKDKDFSNYGARGITVSPRWKTFDGFLADMGKMPDGYSLERIDYNGNYCPENCRWIPKEDQPKNRRTNRKVSLNGEVMNLVDVARRLGATVPTVTRWIAKGNAPEGIHLQDVVQRYPAANDNWAA